MKWNTSSQQKQSSIIKTAKTSKASNKETDFILGMVTLTVLVEKLDNQNCIGMTLLTSYYKYYMSTKRCLFSVYTQVVVKWLLLRVNMSNFGL